MCSKSKFNVIVFNQVQKKPPDVFSKKRCSEKFHKFYRKTPVLESLFKKVAGLQGCNFIKETPIQLFLCEVC